jgi:hypothetical protein
LKAELELIQPPVDAKPTQQQMLLRQHLDPKIGLQAEMRVVGSNTSALSDFHFALNHRHWVQIAAQFWLG